jgi:Uroporphyrinogen decarboxylase (URO-D)
MTFRQRLLSVLSGQRADVMPWFADLTYWAHSQRLAGTYPPEYEGDAGFVKLHADYHVGYYLGYAPVWSSRLDGVEVASETEGMLTTTRWRTPVGDIFGVTQFLPQTASSAPTRWPVTTPDDLRVLRYIAETTQTTPTYETYERQNELASDQGHPTVLPPRSPVSQMLAEWTGAVNLSYLLADAREDVEQTLESLGRAADGPYEAILDCDTPFVELPDNLTGEVVTRLFERYQSDYYLRRLEPLHAAGKKVGVHLDGTMRGIMPLLVKTGLDFIESITPKPCGDVAVEDLRDLAGPDIILFGGMPGAMFAPPFTADDIRRQVELIHEHHWESGKFILGAADQIPPNGSMELVRYVGELCEELGG